MLQDLHHLCGPALDKALQRSLTKAKQRRRITSFSSVTIFSLMQSRRLLTFLIRACCWLVVGSLSTRSHRSFSVELLPQTYPGYSSPWEDLAFSFCWTSWGSSLPSFTACQVYSEWKHKQLEKKIYFPVLCQLKITAHIHIDNSQFLYVFSPFLFKLFSIKNFWSNYGGWGSPNDK